MTAPFFKRLAEYYANVALVLRGEAKTSSIFPNSSDIGASREDIYAQFLKQHAPSKCNVSFGGFVFGEDGTESGQLDVLITTDTTPRFNVSSREGRKSFAPVEGTLGVASIKSTLNKETLENALLEISRIPPTAPLGMRYPQNGPSIDYENWPFKIVYASNGIELSTLFQHLQTFYFANAYIPTSPRPDVIHVAGKYVIFKARAGDSLSRKGAESIPVAAGQYVPLDTHPDVQAIARILQQLQLRATLSTHILFSYQSVVEGVLSTLDA
jgi:hypothetical protein